MKIIDDGRRLALLNEKTDTLAQMDYQITAEGELWVTHTFTSPDQRDQGYASDLFKALVENAQKEKRHIISTCSYVSKKLTEVDQTY